LLVLIASVYATDNAERSGAALCVAAHYVFLCTR
jgi:hypothetical protein